jgi:hypothetical protein
MTRMQPCNWEREIRSPFPSATSIRSPAKDHPSFLKLEPSRSETRKAKFPAMLRRRYGFVRRTIATVIFVFSACVPAATPARAADITGATYDFPQDQLVLDVVYMGITPDHLLSLVWGPCIGNHPHHVVAGVKDAGSHDPALQAYNVRVRFDLKEVGCRPALITVGVERSFVTLYVPARNELARRASLAASRTAVASEQSPSLR